MKIGQLALLSYYSLILSNQSSSIHAFTLQHQHQQHHRQPNSFNRQRTTNNNGSPSSSSSSLYMSISPLEEQNSTTSSSSSIGNTKTVTTTISTADASAAAAATAEAASTGRSSEEIERELASGRILEDGPVIDYGSIKDTTSKAEIALANARQEYLQQQNQIPSHHPPQIQSQQQQQQQGRLMGINDDVVAEVGREVGAFVNDDALIQNCASYLRSKAPQNMFDPHTTTTASTSASTSLTYTTEEEGRFESLLRESYMESGLVTEAFAKTFYLGTQLLPLDAREAIWAVYVWCRRTDEIVDAPRNPGDVSMLTDLSEWEIRLENLFEKGIVEDVLDLPLLDCKIKYPNLPIEPFVDMIRGMLMDIPDLGQDRYDTFEELHLYCYRVAGTVGLMSMPIFGCAPGFTEAVAKYVTLRFISPFLWFLSKLFK